MNNLKIYAYHRITKDVRGSLSVTAGNFERQICYLIKKGYKNINLSQLYEKYLKDGKKLESKYFILTFDDGYADNYIHLFPILKKYNLTATIFITHNYISSNNLFPWDLTRFTNPIKEDYAMTWDNVKEMMAFGIDFGSHTLNHNLLTTVSQDIAFKEINESKKVLEENLGKEIISFCYPAGNLNEEICNMVKNAGYKVGVVTPPRKGIKETYLTLKRIGVYSSDNFLKFIAKSNKLLYYLREISKK